MELSCGVFPGREAVGHAQLAESLGYKSAFFYDSPALYGDLFVAMARVAERTERIGLGTAVLVPSLRHVMSTAAAVASLEQIAPGRITVAVGTGFTGRVLLGQPPLPWSQVEAYVRDLKGLLRGFEVEIDGKVTKMMHPEGLAPKRPITTPILVAANGPKGVAVADRVGDGVMCARTVAPGARDCVLLSFGTVLDTGESFESPRVVEALGPAIALVYHGAYQAAGAAVDALPGGASWRAEIEATPEAVRHLYVHEGHAHSLTARDRRHISAALGADRTFSGTAEQLREKVSALADQGVRELVYAPTGPDVADELRRMAEAIG